MPGTRRSFAVVAVTVALLTAACDNGVRHPLDDSETKPATAAEALDEATNELDRVGAAVLTGLVYEATEWEAPDRCATRVDSPEQGDVSTILYRGYATPPSGQTAADVLAAATHHWEGEGHTVGPGAPNMPDQAITRVDGISYSVVDEPPGVELRAFLPCY